MKIWINDVEQTLPAVRTFAEVIQERNLSPESVVVMCNGKVIPQDAMAAATVNDGDRLTLLAFVGGG